MKIRAVHLQLKHPVGRHQAFSDVRVEIEGSAVNLPELGLIFPLQSVESIHYATEKPKEAPKPAVQKPKPVAKAPKEAPRGASKAPTKKKQAKSKPTVRTTKKVRGKQS